MAGNKEREEDKKNTNLLSMVLFLLIGGFIALQSYGLSQVASAMSGNMSSFCNFVPESVSCPHNASQESKAVDVFLYMQTTSLLLQIVALIAVFARIYVCAKYICVRCCFECWYSVCMKCGLSWILFETLSGIVSICSAILVGAELSVEDVRQFNGFVPCVINGVFGIVKSIGYCIYHEKVGFPPNDVFFGKNKKYSDVKYSTRVTTHKDGHGNQIPVKLTRMRK